MAVRNQYSSTPSPQDSFEHLRPQLHRAQNRHGSRLAQTAERGINHRGAYIRQALAIAGERLARSGAVENLVLAPRAELAGITLAAAFVGKKVREPLKNIPHICRIIEHHYSP